MRRSAIIAIRPGRCLLGTTSMPSPGPTSAAGGGRRWSSAWTRRAGTSSSLASRFEPDGSIRYRAAPGATDYGRTHFCDEASGLTGEVVFRLLEAGVYAGDRTMVDEGLRLLRIVQRRFDHGVPRGAQTWEIPLHTPDVLGSAYLVKAFALGHELTGDSELLDAARYWAWTGVPFVYLVNPTAERGPAAVGPYATTPVLGATNWVAPNWIGLPVQWCGLVYADSLVQLARLDPDGPWQALAEGITASGILQTYPQDHPHHGLLPDSFNLSTQSRNPSAINPGTLQPLALRLLARNHPAATPYEFRALPSSGLWVHAPGAFGRSSRPAGLGAVHGHALESAALVPGDPRRAPGTRESAHRPLRWAGHRSRLAPPVPARPGHPDPSGPGEQTGLRRGPDWPLNGDRGHDAAADLMACSIMDGCHIEHPHDLIERTLNYGRNPI